MAPFLVILAAFAFLPFLLLLFVVPTAARRHAKLPPGPPGLPFVGNLLHIALSGKPFMDVVKDLRMRYGPIFTLRMGGRTHIVVSSASLAHEALIQKGQLFATRPPEFPTKSMFSCNKFTINSSFYGSVWRSLRRNLVSEMLTPSRIKEFHSIRCRSLDLLVTRLKQEAKSTGVVSVLQNVRFAAFSILLSMCFGVEMEEEEVVQVDDVLKRVLIAIEPRIDDFLPVLRPLFKKQRGKAEAVRSEQLRILTPMVEKRRKMLSAASALEEKLPVAYVDTLFDLEVDGRRLTAEEVVTLCSEFINGGTDTTAAAVEWGMAHLLLDPDIQANLHAEVHEATGGGRKKAEEVDIEKMEYLNAFVKELLRKHPPTYFVLTHAVTEPTKLGGYDIPANVSVDFYSPAVSEDPSLWDSPDKFSPERFLKGEDADITGVKGVKMMPFGVGRRICPGLSLGTLHISLMVARMVQEFQWMPPPGCKVIDMSERYAFTVVAKTPVRAVIKARVLSKD